MVRAILDFSGCMLQFFFLFTPFFALSMFLCLTAEYPEKRKRLEATRIMLFSFLICEMLVFFGDQIFRILGININGFSIGVGLVLLLDGIALVKGRVAKGKSDPNRDIAVVPMAIPVIVGPATIGAIMVMGAEWKGMETKMFRSLSILAAAFMLWIMLFLSTKMEKWLGARGLQILSKITGLILASLAAQMMLTGAGNGWAKIMNDNLAAVAGKRMQPSPSHSVKIEEDAPAGRDGADAVEPETGKRD